MRNFLRKKRPNQHINYSKTSYSQCGEDLIIEFIFQQLKIDKPSYLDLGAHHPQYLSNTYLFYKKGSHGLNVEPDPTLINAFYKERSADLNINAGVGLSLTPERAKFYIMSARTLNTFSKDEAERIQNYGSIKIESIEEVDLLPLKSIIQSGFPSSCPNFVSVDIEGIDFEVIKTFDFNTYRPEVFCIETLTYTEDNTETKEWEIVEYLKSKNYMIFADTYINTIFVDCNSWKQR